MKTSCKTIGLLLTLFAIITPIKPGSAAVLEPESETIPVMVGRLAAVEGQAVRYDPALAEWWPAPQDSPIGAGDSLYTYADSRAEIIMPNGTWVRIDGETQVQFTALEGDGTNLALTSGTARIDNKGTHTVVILTTPFGSVTTPPYAALDLYLGPDGVEVVALEGTVYFTHNNGSRYEVVAGSASLAAGPLEVWAGNGYGDSDWQTWNDGREALWADRMATDGDSRNYLPPNLSDHAYELDQNGVWETVYYENHYRYLWRPLGIAPGWSPFTVGYWTVWYGDNTWIPCEPFGYVTHHYGGWIFSRGFWYWAPPVYSDVAYHRPSVFSIGWTWYPGRVAWLRQDSRIGWLPLAPRETYYAHRRWSRDVVVVKDHDIYRAGIDVRRYKHHRHAVMVDRQDIYRFGRRSDNRAARLINETAGSKRDRVGSTINTPSKKTGGPGRTRGIVRDSFGTDPNRRPPVQVKNSRVRKQANVPHSRIHKVSEAPARRLLETQSGRSSLPTPSTAIVGREKIGRPSNPSPSGQNRVRRFQDAGRPQSRPEMNSGQSMIRKSKRYGQERTPTASSRAETFRNGRKESARSAKDVPSVVRERSAPGRSRQALRSDPHSARKSRMGENRWQGRKIGETQRGSMPSLQNGRSVKQPLGNGRFLIKR